MEFETVKKNLANLGEDVVFLITEDNRGHYMLTEHCLREAGINNQIVWLEDGQAALDYLNGRGHPRDTNKKYVMLLDIRMPKIDGIEVLTKVKEDEHLKDMAVIMLTTSDDQQVARSCYDLGCDAYVTKPSGQVLLKAIERVTRRI